MEYANLSDEENVLMNENLYYFTKIRNCAMKNILFDGTYF